MSFSAEASSPPSQDAACRHPGLGAIFILLLLLQGCSTSGPAVSSRYNRDYRVSASERVIWDGRPVPKGGGMYKVGSPYVVGNQWYVPREQPDYDRVGIASWYGADFHGRKTANGEVYDMAALTAAHPTLPLPSYAYVTNEATGRTLLVRINDRGPYANDRIIDLSQRVARLLGFENHGLARVRVRYAGPAPADGNDRREVDFLASQRWYAGEPRLPRAPYAQPVAMDTSIVIR